MCGACLPGVAFSFWCVLFVLASPPPEVVRRIYDAAATAAWRPEFRATLARDGTEMTLSRSPEEFAAFLAEDAKFWVRLARETGAWAD